MDIAKKRMLEDRGALPKAEEREYMNRRAKGQQCKRGKREFGKEKESVAVVCKRACCEILSLVWERVVEKGLEGEVDLSSGESEHWLQCALRWLFTPPLFLGIFLDLRV